MILYFAVAITAGILTATSSPCFGEGFVGEEASFTPNVHGGSEDLGDENWEKAMRHFRALSCVALLMGVGFVSGQSQSVTDGAGEGSELPIAPAPQPAASSWTAQDLEALALRPVGPALQPGRIGDIVIHPRQPNIWYVAVASGGIWKTTNRGITWTPIFDQQGSYSIGCLAVDPHNPQIIWVGTGENQSQRSVGFGDGVYKSTDGGKTWQHMGLKHSEHIARILIDPRDSQTVYVASQGPLWASGGDRGLFRSRDGGKTWSAVLTISPETGITDVVMDPSNPDVLYAASYQRRRHVGVLVGGGPESAIFKSTDGGQTWRRLTKGLPQGDLGRIALAVSPQRSNVVYAHIQTAAKERGAFYRSENGGETWERRGATPVQTGEYYGEIFTDPHRFDRLYIMDTVVQMTDDGGKTFTRLRWPVHVDHHALAFDPVDPNHWLSGNDGGLYETYDGGQTWRHFTNMPATQYYRVTVDDAVPFYNIYAGSQDNGTHGGPARTAHRLGIRNADWGVYGGGDGMQPRVEPGNPNIVYVSSQYGALVRIDKTTGRTVPIKPRLDSPKDKQPPKKETSTKKEKEQESVREKDAPGTKSNKLSKDSKAVEEQEKSTQPSSGKAGGDNLRWGWDAPLLISPHSPTRLYMAANRLFQSDDRGTTWKVISPDMTRQLDPLKVPLMGKLWGKNAVSRDAFTTPLSVITALDESPVQAGLLAIGTDDGLVQISENNGQSWRKIEHFPGVPPATYVSDVFFSPRDRSTLYVTFNNWQYGDFRPYVLKTGDLGRNWTNITGNLPDRHPVWSIVADRVHPDLLFVGTEFGLFVTLDGGKQWQRIPGAPPIPFRDLTVQEREGDLVCATFGRGIYILDHYAALCGWTSEARTAAAVLLPIRDTWRVVEVPFVRSDGGFAAPNPPSGAIITYYLRESLSEKDRLVVRIRDAQGRLVRDVPVRGTAGLHRVSWDLRGPSGGKGPMVAALSPAGVYSAQLVRLRGSVAEALTPEQSFRLLSPADRGNMAPSPRERKADEDVESSRSEELSIVSSASSSE